MSFCRHSFAGYRMRVSGMAPAAALYAGFSEPKNVWIAFLASGGLAGLAGVGEVAGPLGDREPRSKGGQRLLDLALTHVAPAEDQW